MSWPMRRNAGRYEAGSETGAEADRIAANRPRKMLDCLAYRRLCDVVLKRQLQDNAVRIGPRQPGEAQDYRANPKPFDGERQQPG